MDHKHEKTDDALIPERTELARERTRLAGKRTFLAWCRTALSFMAFGFLLEKIDVFLASQHQPASETLLNELGILGMLAFLAGPVLMLFAGYRHYQLEKKLGFRQGVLSAIPEVCLMAAVLGAVLFYVFS